MKKHAIYTKRNPVAFTGGEWKYEQVEYEVRVMAEAEGYAMVRRPRAMPFAVSVKDLRFVERSEKRTA